MSKKRKAMHAARTINKKLAGAKCTSVARQRHMNEFIEYCFANQVDVHDPSTVNQDLVIKYTQHLSAPVPDGKGNSVATAQNKLAAVRALLKGQGIDLESKNINLNSAIGMDRRSRVGTKKPVSDQTFEAAVARAMELGEIGFAHAIRVERYLGLRGQEAIMSSAALMDFANEAKQIQSTNHAGIRITDGTKGGRPRETTVISKFATETLRTIHDALEYSSKNGGFLISGKVPGLKAARARYHKIAATVGLVGEYAPHSLRYRYTCDKLEELRDLGIPRSEAMVLASKWLGHGPGRGRWVSMVYGRTVKDSFPKSTRRRSQKNALETIKALIAQFPESNQQSGINP